MYLSHLNMIQHWVCIYLPRSRWQTRRTRQIWSLPASLLDPLEAWKYRCWSRDISCPVPAKTLHSGYRSHFCSCSSRGRNQWSHPVSSGILSTPHRLLFDRRKHQRFLNHYCRLCKHRWLYDRICKDQSSLKLELRFKLKKLIGIYVEAKSY